MDEDRKSAFFRRPARWLKTSLDRLVRSYTYLKNQMEPWAGPHRLTNPIPADRDDMKERMPGLLDREPARHAKGRNVGAHLDTYA